MVRQRFRFGDCTLDVAARELRRGGARVELAPTVFDCIAYLVEHRDRAVGRDELVSAVWGKASVSDTMLGKAVLAARRAVGDDAQEQAFLRTVPRFGYHWVAQVTVDAIDTEPSGTPPPVTARPTDETPRSSTRAKSRTPWIALTAVVLAAIAAAFFWRPPAPTSADRTLVVDTHAAPPDASAVLPAEIAAEPGDAWLRLGFMDLVATRLRAAGLPVVASDSIVRLAPEGTTPEAALAAVRRAVDVRHLVQPALARRGTQWIARAELVDADGTRRAVQAEADNAIAAANEVAERLLELFGRRSAAAAPPVAPTLAELVQRVDAARLSDRMDEARALVANAPAALKNAPELRLREVQVDLRAGSFDAAREHIAAILADVPAETDPVVRGRALEALCVVESRTAHMDAAMRACDEAIDLLQSRNEPIALGRAYHHRGVIHAREVRREPALADFSRARVVLGAAGDPLLLAIVDGNESVVEMSSGRPAEALPGFERAGRQFQRFGMFTEFVVSLINEVEAHLALLDPLEALKTAELGWSERHRISDPALRARYTIARASALADNGRLGESRGLYDEVVGSAGAADDSVEAALARAALARLDYEAGHDANAVLLAQRASAALTSPELASARAIASLTAVRALRRLAHDDQARAQTQLLAGWARGSVQPAVGVAAGVAQAEQAAADRDTDAATAAYESALTLAGAQGRADTQALVATSYAGFLIDAGRLDRAAVVVGLIARYADRDYDSALAQWRLYRALGRADAAASALARVRQLAGERPVPDAQPPGLAGAAANAR
ncbi:winged helix-turn-helix domain-containing protein [Tahibacter soli]|uniref:Winged helix-turn-helix domain-containing protein n=1 Tax=Tahibacter soli TaxID=2983605 RepID=A0A9X3YI42_9GAMM|nr:winged helix-turn-helix domain-containing protein [Tahibacter soli]MDC8011446.1 winged helix-turn-helix domain-containing protein [Tahibacter soli]